MGVARPMSDAKWFVALSGDGIVLDELRQRLEASDIRLEKVENEYRLHWSRFDGLATDTEVLASAQQAVALLNLAGILRIDSFQPVNVGAVIQIQADGSEKHFVRASVTTRVRALFRAEVIRADGTRETPQPEELKPLLAVLELSRKIERATHYVLHEPNWYGYYKAFEAIREHVKGHKNLVARGWSTHDEIRRFTWSAQPKRHHNKPGPPKPMSETEGRAFAITLIERAIAEALSQPQTPAPSSG
jgi:hypothetical protein